MECRRDPRRASRAGGGAGGARVGDPFLVGKCVVSLVQLGDSESYELIRELFAGADNLARKTDLLEKIFRTELYPPVADELLSAGATL
ncbi:MAG: hypothetical protein K9L66_09150 [Spirochaetaceae bacterium]|nr:hypothetical protein [Spirochaetaceae bacterium]MCF7949879.1 hypothetical protein [Spirochaetia bacterium]MCF7951682.1 hypothetical protein [Spirochaetaceae bacterium]